MVQNLSCYDAIRYMKKATDFVYISLENEKDFLKVIKEIENYFQLWQKQLSKGR